MERKSGANVDSTKVQLASQKDDCWENGSFLAGIPAGIIFEHGMDRGVSRRYCDHCEWRIYPLDIAVNYRAFFKAIFAGRRCNVTGDLRLSTLFFSALIALPSDARYRNTFSPYLPEHEFRNHCSLSKSSMLTQSTGSSFQSRDRS